MRAYFTPAVLLTAAIALIAAIAACSPVAADNADRSGIVSISCSNSTSDAATLQHAINSSPAGATIQIAGGTCLLTSGISLPSDRTYAGESRTGTVLRQDAGMSYVLASDAYVDNSPTTGNPVAIRDLSVVCNGSGSTDGIIILNWQVDVTGVDVYGCGGSGIVDTNTTANGGAITNTSVNSRFDNNFISNSGRYGFEVYDSRNSVTDGYFDDNQVATSGDDAIHLDNSAGWQISGDHLYSDGQDGIYANRLSATEISGNYIEDFGFRQKSGTWYGIRGIAQGGRGSVIYDNMIYNDTGEVAGVRYVYAGITGVYYGTGHLSVTGNVILGVRPTDIGFFFAAGPNKLVVASSGNEVAGIGTANIDARNVTQTTGVLIQQFVSLAMPGRA